jgi:hypothetical protein
VSRASSLLGMATLGVVLATAPLGAQGFRGTATTTGRYIEIRTLRLDSVQRTSVDTLPGGMFEYQGSPITCVTGFAFCTRYAAGDVEHAIVLTQDVSATAWGLGMRGLSATLLLRARVDGGGFTWPRSDDPFDAILGYAELDRGDWRVRLGRQRATNGLGFSGYDGVDAVFEPRPSISIEAWAGRSLARGLDEPRNEALKGIEDFVLDRDAWILGGSAHAETRGGIAVNARYQREIWSDRSGLISERLSIDARAPLAGRAVVTASTDYDFAFDRIGKSNLTIAAPLAGGALQVEAAARRYVPYFELWTIWGFFDPSPWHEAELRASWRPRPDVVLRGYGGWRWYSDTHAPVIFSELPDQAKRAGAGVNWTPRESWILDADYSVEIGYGAFLSSADASSRWQMSDRFALTLNATAFQQIEEFRLGDGFVVGGGAAASFDFTERSGIDIGANLYRQTFDNRADSPDWNQFRGWATLRIGFGRDPGQRGGLR